MFSEFRVGGKVLGLVAREGKAGGVGPLSEWALGCNVIIHVTQVMLRFGTDLLTDPVGTTAKNPTGRAVELWMRE